MSLVNEQLKEQNLEERLQMNTQSLNIKSKKIQHIRRIHVSNSL